MMPLDLRPSRLTTAPGEAGEARDRVLRLLERLRSADLGSEEGLRPPDQLRNGGGSSSGGDFTVRGSRQRRVKSVVKATSGKGGKGARPPENNSRETFRHVGTTAASSPAGTAVLVEIPPKAFGCFRIGKLQVSAFGVSENFRRTFFHLLARLTLKNRRRISHRVQHLHMLSHHQRQRATRKWTFCWRRRRRLLKKKFFCPS